MPTLLLLHFTALHLRVHDRSSGNTRNVQRSTPVAHIQGTHAGHIPFAKVDEDAMLGNPLQHQSRLQVTIGVRNATRCGTCAAAGVFLSRQSGLS
jgi:hypothetical protein